MGRMTPQETELFKKAGSKIAEQNDLLKELTAPAYHVGVVVDVLDTTIIIETNGQLFELERGEKALKVEVGQPIDVHPKTGQIVNTSKYVSFGATGNVVAVDGDLIQVALPQGITTVKRTCVPVETGDKVVMNSTNHVILQKIKVETKYAFKTQSVLTWDDIGACEDAKKEMIAALETPYTHKDLFDFFHKKQVKGALLWGRAGNGKTLIGRAAAGSLARMHGKESADSGFIYIKGPEILDKYVGETESQIREAFTFGKAHFKKYGYPAVLFIDEADAILMRRGMRTASGMEMTIVPQFLSEMDGIENSGVFVLLATNRADVLDPAVIRPGRIDRKIYVAPPTKENAASIWNIHMRNVPMAEGTDKDKLIQSVNDSLYSENYPLYLIDSSKGRKVFSLGNLASGALIAGIVERASAIAIDRNIAANTMTGMTQEDFITALTAMHKEQYGITPYDELREFIDGQKLEVTTIQTCHDGSKIEKQSIVQTSPSQVVAIPITKKGGNYDA
jgi:proteasome-associated ATPase